MKFDNLSELLYEHSLPFITIDNQSQLNLSATDTKQLKALLKRIKAELKFRKVIDNG